MDVKDIILVPFDFTEVAEYAAEHAHKLSGIMGNKMALLHIVKKESEIQAATEQLNTKAAELEKKFGSKPEIHVKEGSIFADIAAVAEELNATLVVMGTHGIRGMQKYLGSWALKVIASSKVPFIIVQEPPTDQIINDILLPINFKKENKEAATWISFISKFFNAKFHIFRSNTSDPKLKRGVESNVYFASKYLTSKGIDFEITRAEGKKDFAKETIDFAATVKPDLIIIMTTKDIGFTDYMLGAHEQYIIANSAKIPVMCINPKPPRYLGSYKVSGG